MKTIEYLLLIFTVTVLLIQSGCEKTEDPVLIVEEDPILDIDGNVYKTVHIGNQRWMAEYFIKIHNIGKILIVPNAWDVASAKIFELAGFKAIGTTSAGISSILGSPDGKK